MMMTPVYSKSGPYMSNVMGIINNALNETFLEKLTNHRSLASVPYGSRYRLIDFPLSNMVNSGITNVGILLESKYRSLMDHIGFGKAWDLDRKRNGLFILPPAHIYQNNRAYKGDLQNFSSNIDYIKRSTQEYVIITSPNIVCNIDYRDAFQYHIENENDITIIYKEMDVFRRDTSYTVINTDDNDRIIDMKVNPDKNFYKKISLQRYIIKKDLLLEIIDNCISKGEWDFVKNAIIGNIKNLKVYGYPFHSYASVINSINGYYKSNLELLKPDVWQELFLKNGSIFTKPKDEAPSEYKESSIARNILAANGCIIEGEVRNSILFRGVKIHPDSFIKNSIIMQKSEIGPGAKLENVILDKGVTITADKELKGDTNYPVILEKNSIV
ncbi:glucose-1-phosphate adenylyltransferase subunit GlgD [Halanaerobium sp. DL-01]|uniref:glucose-1-phosphate adenylyltransferase subunit GlgD n=1 Tax=unclassified Halanaerobium TaxID=2641197 RepID=UPI000E134728|nr:glucose-1-phosphate adenylyltransferase subunit GlgD [Halanaerobium sp. DL-01]RCW49853.1 glucose-1-phosphate adenylyltransferase [Halanaerobium sp. MA284_MarDTE_T2]RCW88497.1 glucose-1-phosphate adenylyltransferase [Halanaerobium sp. DL-01]